MNQATYLTDFSKRLKTVTAHNCQLKKMPWCFSTDIGQFCKNYFIFEKPLKEGTSFSWLNVGLHLKNPLFQQKFRFKSLFLILK